MLAVNLAILFLTGARAPAAYAAIVIGGSLILAPGSAVPRAHRLVLIAAGLTAVPLTLGRGRALRVASPVRSARRSRRQSERPRNCCGRCSKPPRRARPGPAGALGPATSSFRATARSRPSWAPGPRTTNTCAFWSRAAIIGRTLLIVLFVLWADSHIRRLPPLERVVMSLIFLVFAAHAMTDNVLISTPACVLFAFIAAVYAEAEDNARERLREAPDVA